MAILNDPQTNFNNSMASIVADLRRRLVVMEATMGMMFGEPFYHTHRVAMYKYDVLQCLVQIDANDDLAVRAFWRTRLNEFSKTDPESNSRNLTPNFDAVVIDYEHSKQMAEAKEQQENRQEQEGGQNGLLQNIERTGKP